MLINCPKCGFSQPKDRYCASCGVDMENYRPAKPPAWKKVLGNPFLHVGFIFVLVFISILFIRKQQRDELRARVEYLKGGPVLVERQQALTTAAAKGTPQPAGESAAETPPVAPDIPPPTAVAASNAATPTAVAAPARGDLPTTTQTGNSVALMANTTGTSQNRPLKMIATYAEVDTNTLNAWLDEMRANGQLRPFDNVMMGALNQTAAKIRAAGGFKVLQKVERVIDPASPNVEWFVGTHHGGDPETEMGLFSSLAILETGNGLYRGEVEVQRAFRDPKDLSKAMDRVSFGGPFEIPAGSAYLMAGLIPRQYVAGINADQNPDAFLSLFKSSAFANRQTEFTLLIEFDTSAP